MNRSGVVCSCVTIADTAATGAHDIRVGVQR
jgi:hypothetical protein